jgi:PAS domain S-box-containing protein
MENRKIKILAIDDIPDNLISIKAQIRQAIPEAIIFTAINGEKGIELAVAEDPDVILLDVVMPDMDGYEVCQLMKADPKISNIPVVFITANKSDQESRIRALECGAEALLSKPIDPIELIAQIRAMVKVKEAGIIAQNEEERLTQLVEEQVRELKANHTATLNLLEDLRNEVEIRAHNEKKLEASEEHYRVLTQSANDAIISINSDGVVDEWNKGAEKIFGYTKNEICGKQLTMIIPQQYAELHQNGINKLILGGDRHIVGKTVELSGLNKNGLVIPIELSLSEWETSFGKFFTGIIRDISERKNAEQRIREKDIQFRKLSANLPDMIFQFTRRTDGTYCVPVASEGMWNIYGFSPNDVVDDFSPILKLIYPEDLGRLIGDIEYSAEHMIPFDCKYRVQIPGQAIKWMHSRSTPELLADGSISWYGFVMDITVQRKVEEMVQHSEEKFRTIAEQTSDLISICDAKGFITYASPACREIFRCEPEEMCGQNFIEFVDPAEVPSVLDIFHNSLLLGKNVKNIQFNMKRKDNSIFFGELIGSPFMVGHVNSTLVIIRDISERKLAEQELITAKENAQESEARLKLATSAGLLGIWDWNVKDNVMIWDDRMFELYGIARDTFPSNVDAWTNGLHPDDKHRAIDECYASLNNGKNFDTSFRVVQPNGKIVHIKANALVFKEPDGKPRRMIGINKDISVSVYAEEQLFLAKEHAEQSDRLKSAFLANMSHEIRTPMNGILGFAELLKEPGLNGDDQQNYIRIIEKSGARMLNIINDIVDISKIESQQMKVSVSVTNVNEKIEYIHTFFKPETDKKGIEFCFQNGLPEKEANILTDKEKIYAILTNLVKNAIKFCDKGVIEIGYNLVETLHATSLPNTNTSLQNPAMSLQFYVKDTGIGIQKNKQEVVFDRFIQADIADKRAFQGAGLGLSISKAYVEMLGGQIWVESEEGKGSTFFFTLPYRTALEEEPAITRISIKEVETLRQKLKILIAEDDEVSEKILETIVNKFSQKVLKAKTGIEAISTCRAHPDIDLVLMDIKMPEMDGYEATRQIRQFNPGVVIIAQTAFAFIGDSEKAKLVGCNDYIVKPIGRLQFHKMIIKHFREQIAI